MRELLYVIDEASRGMTVKNYLRRKKGFSSRAFVRQKQFEDGLSLNGKRCVATDVLCEGDALKVVLHESERSYEPMQLPLDIIFENDDYLIIDKPASMPSHPSPGHGCDSVLNAVAWHYQKTGQSHEFRAVYRLDRDTTGVFAVAKSRLAVSAAEIEKTYYAVCVGQLEEIGRIDLPVGRMPGSIIKREIGHGENAVTDYRCMACRGDYTLLELKLKTGRTHQIRVHLAAIGHPVAGDSLYGNADELFKTQALHCGKLLLKCEALDFSGEFSSGFPQSFERLFPGAVL